MSESAHSCAVLELVGIKAGYNGRTILRDLTLTIRAGDSVALIGPNGCGKSTLLRVVTGLLACTEGEVKPDGSTMRKMQPDERIRRRIGYLKQAKNAFEELTVEANLALAGDSVQASNGGERRLHTILEAFPVLAGCLDTRAGLLSGGQRQALAVAMVLMRPTKLLLPDKPVAGLSPTAGRGLLNALGKLQQAEGFAAIIVEHLLRQVQPHLGRVLVMREGHYLNGSEP